MNTLRPNKVLRGRPVLIGNLYLQLQNCLESRSSPATGLLNPLTLFDHNTFQPRTIHQPNTRPSRPGTVIDDKNPFMGFQIAETGGDPTGLINLRKLFFVFFVIFFSPPPADNLDRSIQLSGQQQNNHHNKE